MECLYYPALSENKRQIWLDADEARHSKALRLKPGDKVLITDGAGLTALCSVEGEVRQPYYIVEKLYRSHNELPFRYTAIVGVIESKDRLEFCVEKLTELGVAEIRLAYFARSVRVKLDKERLERKMLAAMKQSKRSVLPELLICASLPDAFENLIYSRLVVGSMEGKAVPRGEATDTVMVIGPEGGMTAEEEGFIAVLEPQQLKIGVSRLRTETAAIALMARIA